MTVAVPGKSLEAWHSPPSRPELMDELIHGVDRYNPTNLGLLEEYLGTQIREGEYDIFADLAILKLYQFNPQLSNPEVIINILLQSLSATVHGPDFNLCLALLREPAAILHDIETDDQSLVAVLPFLQQLHELSRSCQFTAFWTEFNSSSEGANIVRDVYVPQQSHLVHNFRQLFSTSVASCFSRIALLRIQRWLDLPESDVEGWCESVGWNVEGDQVVIPKNGDNDVKAGVVKENVQLNQLTKLIAAAAY